MPKEKKRRDLKDQMESMDQFKVEHNFQYTAKEAKGTVIGFCLSTVYFILLLAYLYKRIHLFWTHEEDTYQTYKIMFDFDEADNIFLEDTGFSAGVALQSTAPEYQSAINSHDELFQYIDIFSVSAIFESDDVLG